MKFSRLLLNLKNQFVPEDSTYDSKVYLVGDFEKVAVVIKSTRKGVLTVFQGYESEVLDIYSDFVIQANDFYNFNVEVVGNFFKLRFLNTTSFTAYIDLKTWLIKK